jgi:RNA polymerase sigma-70 factor (ECF subfamily)
VGQGLGPAVAQEVTQDVFVDLFLALRKGRPLWSERRWLYTVAGRAAVDYWRREGRPVWVELDSQQAAADALPSRVATPDIQASDNERLERISVAMCRLPKEQRLGIHLRMHGLRYREIASILGVSTSTAADWISAAVERLRGGLHD